ncbi:hypothetical protein RUM43_007125 [Polyplax serrata]|uniref:Uncharacterized protein n=1 Tax=Polyplax serrata TaxID=468196 RepID=A0AAN8PM83_POLSC
MSCVDLRESSEGGFYGEDDFEFNFPFTYYGGEYGIDNFDDGYEVLPRSRSETGTPLFYPTVADSQYEEGFFEPIFTEQTEAAFGSIGDKSSTTSTSPQPEKVSPETRRVSMFVHSCPSHFSDINRARKSVFGSIFLRTTGRVVDETNLLKSITESNYSMLQSLLSSFERVISLVPSDTERKHMMQAYKESVMRMLEHSGIRRTYSDGSIHWDIYPIAQSYLFTLQVDDHIHQTRNLSKIEERIISGTTQTLRVPYEWPTSSVWSGNWDGLGMSGSGTYTMPHGEYNVE